jgi:glycerol-3-phosphate acyltransferase PlsY
MGEYIVALIAGYLLGSIPFGLILTRVAGLGDIRAIGSGNIGATNVLRTGNKALAAATLILDGAKGAAAAILGGLYGGPDMAYATGLAAVIGHDFPVWLKFKGGKGVATTLGVLLGAFWPVGAIACATWLMIAGIFRYSSLAALTAFVLAPVFAYILADPHLAILAAVLAVIGIARHHANIRRLIAGEEPRIGGKKV